MGIPEKLLLRRRDVLGGLGISEWEMRQLVESGALAPVYLQAEKANQRAYYHRAQVLALMQEEGQSTEDSRPKEED